MPRAKTLIGAYKNLPNCCYTAAATIDPIRNFIQKNKHHSAI